VPKNPSALGLQAAFEGALDGVPVGRPVSPEVGDPEENIVDGEVGVEDRMNEGNFVGKEGDADGI